MVDVNEGSWTPPKDKPTTLDARASDIQNLMNELTGAFDWYETPQGHEHWSRVHGDLLGLLGMIGERGHEAVTGRFRALVACQNTDCAEEVSYHLDMLRVFNGAPICETCYAEDVVVGEDGEYGTDWNSLGLVRMNHLCE